MNDIKPFMQNIVGVPDLSSDDIVKELHLQAEDPNPDDDLIRELYSRLCHLLLAAPASDISRLREAFRTRALIFAQGEWHTIRECVWSSGISVPAKINLSQVYSDMATLFVESLRLSSDIDMAYDEILYLAGTFESTSINTLNEVKEALRRFSSLLPSAKTQPDRKQILETSVFPVRYPNGVVQLASAAAVDFVIVDQQPIESNLGSSARMLDFTPSEVLSLKPLIVWAGLESRLHSAKINDEMKSSRSTELSAESQRDIRSKAHALCRIAIEFKSPRARDIKPFHDILRQSKVFQSPFITPELCQIENGSTNTVNQHEVELYFQYTDHALNIHVPEDPCRQDLCFLFDLPHALLEWIMAEILPQLDDGEAELAKRLITNVLNSKPAIAKQLLDKEGIVELGSIEGYVGDGDLLSAVETQQVDNIKVQDCGQLAVSRVEDDTTEKEDSLSLALAHLSLSSKPPDTGKHSSSCCDQEVFEPVSRPQPCCTDVQSSQAPQLNASSLASSGTNPRLLPNIPPSQAGNSATSRFAFLLARVVKAARSSSFLRNGVYENSTVDIALPEIYAATKATYDDLTGPHQATKLYAAGILYVFELLSNLVPNLPQSAAGSSTFKQVALYPEFSGMNQKYLHGLAHIIYPDSSSTLTAALIDHGYLDQSKWSGRNPTYYIDVYNFLDADKNIFRLDPRDYPEKWNMLGDHKDKAGHEAIYVIFYVDISDHGSVQHKVLVDPKDLENRGVLRIRSHPTSPSSWFAETVNGSGYSF
ncbi:hypothetical protein F5B22DRAFT_656031 [Xylaria bambusicola]|uniref:uncharacterized protein n=1 Tax=Xylaria bambusicola TaxID=326684 RepID=UPI002008E5FF|nr:uncharacterized protein F5B22DRAFT_656031 [Xylaria bambusicola]KAI0516873.1 hypothetical protein F5B22DRAFT_656031 [Xylaria bambusicola]